MLIPVPFVSVIITVTLIELEVLQVNIANSYSRFSYLASSDEPGLQLSTMVKSSKYATSLSPDQIVLLRLHAQEVDRITMRYWHHLYVIKVL
jgi:hypothetical protein